MLVAVLVGLSPTFGRAHPTGQYRPPLPPDALTNGCYPLPAGVTLDFPYQVRSDGDVEGRRKLVLQYDLIDRDEAIASLKRSFAAKAFTDVTYAVVPLSPLKKDQIVRGTITLDLPRIAAQSSAAVCNDVTSTKRFPSDQASHDVGVPGGVE